MPTDHFDSETQARRLEMSEAVEDRRALNVRREGLALLDGLVERAKRLERALSDDEIETVALLLDRETSRG